MISYRNVPQGGIFWDHKPTKQCLSLTAAKGQKGIDTRWKQGCQEHAAFLTYFLWDHVIATSICSPHGGSSKIHGLPLYLLLTHWQLAPLVGVGFPWDSQLPKQRCKEGLCCAEGCDMDLVLNTKRPGTGLTVSLPQKKKKRKEIVFFLLLFICLI